jgi:hypothetical protein
MSGARLRSDFWVGAYLRLCNAQGASAVLRKRGAAEAGAIFVVLDRLDGTQALYAPAPQSLADDTGERLFTQILQGDAMAVMAKLEREMRFDSDLWVIDVEDRTGNARLALAEIL